MALKKLSLIRGNTQTYNVTMRGTDGTSPYCIKNWVVYFTLKTNPTLTDAQASLQKIITTFSDTTGGTSGVATIPITANDTKDLAVGAYDFDIKVLTSASESHTVMVGKFELEQNITQSIGTAGTA